MSDIFQIYGYNFLDSIKDTMLKLFSERLFSYISLILSMKKITNQLNIKCIVSLNESGETERTMLEVNNKKFPSILLEHGFIERVSETKRFDILSEHTSFNDKIVVNKINTMNQLRVQMQQDWSLRNNYLQFAMNQDMNWYYDYYYRNNLSRKGFGSAFDFYWNRHDIWWNWGFNSHNWWGYDWYKPYYYNPYYYNPYYWRVPTFKKDFDYKRKNDVAYVIGRRSSNIERAVDKLKTIIKNDIEQQLL